MAEPDRANLAQAMSDLDPKDKAPASARILNAWITQAQGQLGSAGPRLGWLVAATVVSAALQRAVDDSGAPLFLLKGGTMMQYRLPGMSRTTQDIDGLIRGDIDAFLAELDGALSEPWGPLTLVRDDVEIIDVPYLVVKPRRFHITVQLRGVTWRRVQIEIAPDEGGAGSAPDTFAAPSLAGFGLPTPERIAGLSMSYQIAQKIHACTDPHSPPVYINDRARDVVDLLLLRDLVRATGNPSPAEIRRAIEDVFAARAAEAKIAGVQPRAWPATVTAHPHWDTSFARAAESATVDLTLTDAVGQLAHWLDEIARA